MMKSAVFLLELLVVFAGATVNSDEDDRVSFTVTGSVAGDNFTVIPHLLYDPVYSNRTKLPIRLPRSNLNVGYICPVCRFLFGIAAKVAAIPGEVRVENVRFYRAGVRITAVNTFRTAGSRRANCRIVGGGVGASSVIVRFTSHVGQGFEYQLHVWGE